jgi:hypothetical protein
MSWDGGRAWWWSDKPVPDAVHWRRAPTASAPDLEGGPTERSPPRNVPSTPSSPASGALDQRCARRSWHASPPFDPIDGLWRSHPRRTFQRPTQAPMRRCRTIRRCDPCLPAPAQHSARRVIGRLSGARVERTALTLKQRGAVRYIKEAISLRKSLRHPNGRSGKVLKCWSEWQDLNLRPPRPERGLTRPER